MSFARSVRYQIPLRKYSYANLFGKLYFVAFSLNVCTIVLWLHLIIPSHAFHLHPIGNQWSYYQSYRRKTSFCLVSMSLKRIMSSFAVIQKWTSLLHDFSLQNGSSESVTAEVVHILEKQLLLQCPDSHQIAQVEEQRLCLSSPTENLVIIPALLLKMQGVFWKFQLKDNFVLIVSQTQWKLTSNTVNLIFIVSCIGMLAFSHWLLVLLTIMKDNFWTLLITILN